MARRVAVLVAIVCALPLAAPTVASAGAALALEIARDEVLCSSAVDRNTPVVARNSGGREREFTLFGSMLETNGQGKPFRFVAD